MDGKKTAAILVAGGSGRRMGRDKMFLELDGVPVLARSVLPLEQCAEIDEIIIAVRPGEVERCRREIVHRFGLQKVKTVTVGGQERVDSVRRAMDAVSEDVDIVLIHDGARPFVTEVVIQRVLDACREYGTAVPAVPVKDTVKIFEPSENGLKMVRTTPDRSRLAAVQTPQGFSFSLLKKAFQEETRMTDADRKKITDDASLIEWMGGTVVLTEGEEENIKITTPSDLILAEQILKKRKSVERVSAVSPDASGPDRPAPVPRVGFGYDVHAFAPYRRLILGGVTIPFGQGLDGHSDADVLVHAVMDALLGAAAEGDIGRHFPDSDPRYEGADSLILMEEVGRMLRKKGWQIANIDAVVVAQKPKIAPYLEEMKKNMAGVLQIHTSQISIKGTTTEHLGFTGREEGIAAQAVALLYALPH